MNAMILETNMRLSHAYEIACIVPFSGVLFAWLLHNSSPKSHSSVPGERVFTARIWSTIILSLLLLSFYHGESMSPAVYVPPSVLVLSSFFISYPAAQKVFHIFASCSWIGCFDLYFRTIPQENLGHFLCWKWILATVMPTAAVLRGHLGNKWQYGNVPLMLIGIPLLYLYYWGLEMPICDLVGEESGLSCELSQGPPPRFASCGIDGHYRLYGLFSIAVVHFLFGQIMSLFFVEECREDRSPSELERGKNTSLEKEGVGPGEATLTVTKTSAVKIPTIDISMAQPDGKTLPDDIIEISEEEAFDIVQKGLLNFKTKRAN